jgi:hypothetical protein
MFSDKYMTKENVQSLKAKLYVVEIEEKWQSHFHCQILVAQTSPKTTY